jgi:hypothetical protein
MITPSSALAILDEEAKLAERESAKLTRDAIRDASPVGPGRGGKHLRDQYRYNVTRTAYGYKARLRRLADGWYGRIVERGRHAGFSRGRHYPAAAANPYVERVALEVSPAVQKILEAGGMRAAARIETEIR